MKQFAAAWWTFIDGLVYGSKGSPPVNATVLEWLPGIINVLGLIM
jgi:hypothetical protein